MTRRRLEAENLFRRRLVEAELPEVGYLHLGHLAAGHLGDVRHEVRPFAGVLGGDVERVADPVVIGQQPLDQAHRVAHVRHVPPPALSARAARNAQLVLVGLKLVLRAEPVFRAVELALGITREVLEHALDRLACEHVEHLRPGDHVVGADQRVANVVVEAVLPHFLLDEDLVHAVQADRSSLVALLQRLTPAGEHVVGGRARKADQPRVLLVQANAFQDVERSLHVDVEELRRRHLVGHIFHHRGRVNHGIRPVDRPGNRVGIENVEVALFAGDSVQLGLLAISRKKARHDLVAAIRQPFHHVGAHAP